MGGIIGRLFREFAVVLSVAIGMSLLISLTVTPMMCAKKGKMSQFVNVVMKDPAVNTIAGGVGALLALLIPKNELNVVGLIGIILLIGIVKKSAILMVDFVTCSPKTART